MIKLETLCSRPCLTQEEKIFHLVDVRLSLKQVIESKNNSERQKQFRIICMSVSNKLTRVINFQVLILMLRTTTYISVIPVTPARSCLISTYVRQPGLSLMPEGLHITFCHGERKRCFIFCFSPYQQTQRAVFPHHCYLQAEINHPELSFSHLH